MKGKQKKADVSITVNKYWRSIFLFRGVKLFWQVKQ